MLHKARNYEFSPPSSVSRCPWAKSELSIAYHDKEWGVPVHDDRILFEFLILEGAQAGLSWETILKKREHYRKALAAFNPRALSSYGAEEIEELLANPGIVRNRRKIESAIDNATAYLEVKKEYGSFDAYLWRFVNGRPRVNQWRCAEQIPAHTPQAESLSKDLSRRGFRFVGPTICYAFMQAVGMVNDHLVSCFRHAALSK